MNEKLRELNVEFLFSAVLQLQTMEECYDFFEDLCTVPELKAMAQRNPCGQDAQRKEGLFGHCRRDRSIDRYDLSCQALAGLRKRRL